MDKSDHEQKNDSEQIHDPGIDFHRQYIQKKGSPPGARRDMFRAMSFLSHIAIMIAACVAAGVFLGMFLDNLLGTSPWLLLVCSFLGMAAAFKSLFDIGMKK